MLLLFILFLHLFPGTEDNMESCFLTLKIAITNPVGSMSTCHAVWVGKTPRGLPAERPAYYGSHYNVQVCGGVIGEKEK